MSSKLSTLQRRSLSRAIAAYPAAIRAESSGERVTLASLYRAELLTRRVWREGRSPADNAHEYTASPPLMRAV